MKLALLLPLLVVAFETSHANDVARGDGGRLRALQEELSMPDDMSLVGVKIEIETPKVSPAKFIGQQDQQETNIVADAVFTMPWRHQVQQVWEREKGGHVLY